MDTEPQATQPRRQRRRFQFRLRTLFVVVAIVAVQCAVCLPILREWEEREQRAMLLRDPFLEQPRSLQNPSARVLYLSPPSEAGYHWVATHP